MTPEFREYVYRPRNLRRLAQTAAIRRLQIWAACTRMSTAFGDVAGRGGGDNGAKDGKLAALSDANNICLVLEGALKDAETGMLVFAKTVEHAETKHAKRDADLLRLRYARCLPWSVVQNEMNRRGHICENERTIYKWNRDALDRIEKLWEATNTDEYHTEK